MFTDDASHMGTRATPVKKKDLDRHDVPDTEEQSLFDLVQSRVLSKVLASVSPANDIMAIPNMDVKERAYRRFSDPTPDRATRSRHSDDDYSWSRPPSCPFQHYRATAMGRNEKVSGWDGAGSYQSDYDASLEGHHAKTDWSRYDIKTEIVNLAEGMEPNDGGNDDIKESDVCYPSFSEP